MLSDEEISTALGYATMRGYRDKVLLQAQEQATRKVVAEWLDSLCPHRSYFIPEHSRRRDCNYCFDALLIALQRGEIPKEE